MSSRPSSRHAAAGRLTRTLGLALALVVGLWLPIVDSPSPVAAADAFTTTDLNLRAGPGLDRFVKLVIPPGAPLDLLSEEGDLGFYKVDYQGVRGYAWAEFVSTGVAAGPVQGGTAAAGSAFTVDDLNLRAGPGTDNAVLDVIPRGGQVTLTGDVRGGFAAAVYGQETGWVSEAFLALTSGDDRDDGRDPGSGDEGTTYTTTDLNLRTGPSTSTSVILVMPPGAELTLTGREQAGFAGVSYGGVRGWASTQYLADEPVAEPAAAPASGGGDIVSIIYAAAAAYGQDGDALLAVAQCESQLSPNAYNASSGASGLFQFLPGTFASTPYYASSVFDPVANANAAAWMWSVGRRGEWVC